MKFTYNPNEDIPDLAGKIILLTGGKYYYKWIRSRDSMALH